ncbi:MAG: hydantoinase/oxoprolinase family protein [Alphaproteobacteria bacterium]
MSHILAADTGGTFTDLVAYDLESGRITCTKSLTTYGSLVDGVMSCIDKADLDLEQAAIVKHGTTLVINTFVQRTGAKTALVTTAGFRDLLETRRGNRPSPFRLDYRREPALVPRDQRFEVIERMNAEGEVLKKLDVKQLTSIAAKLRKSKVQAVAVSFLNSYLNAAHEERAATILRKLLPGVYVTAGTELTREWYEYERTATAAANAYVGPALNTYINEFDQRLKQEGFRRKLFMMASNGGVYPVNRALVQPVMLVESGPVGGCIGAAVYAQELNIPNVIAFDMGGTTAKCALIEGGQFEVKSPYYVGGYDTGFPIRGTVLDIVEVGAGGGSIAWLDTQKRLHVGPRSAGSAPGPVCYDRGGTEPTVTDANLVLSRIGDESFLGGEMRLDVKAAERAIAQKVAAPLGFVGRQGIDEAAQGLISLCAATMSGAIKQITIERGRDPREFALFVFGGGGPLHGAALARELHIPLVIVPPQPGNFSALGMLLADARIDNSRTFLRRFDESSAGEMAAIFDDLEAEAAEVLKRDVGSADCYFERYAEMRYVGQKHSLRTLIGRSKSLAAVRNDFEATYKKRYGHADSRSEIEFVGLVSSAFAKTAKPDLNRLQTVVSGRRVSTVSSRMVYFPEAGRRLQTKIYDRYELPAGFAAAGPAIVEEYGTTTIVGPNDSFTVGKFGELQIRCE